MIAFDVAPMYLAYHFRRRDRVDGLMDKEVGGAWVGGLMIDSYRDNNRYMTKASRAAAGGAAAGWPAGWALPHGGYFIMLMFVWCC